MAHFDGNIQVIDRPELVADAVAALRQYEVIGFDTETRPSFKRGKTNLVSLIQLSCDDTCYLFRINDIGFDSRVRELLEDESIIKVGASVHDDFLNLNKLEPFKPGGFIDIQQFVKQYHIADNSLARIYAILFGQRISKNQRLTNWEQHSLTHSQQLYAALDAVACTRIYFTLRNGAFDPASSPYRKEKEPDTEA